MPEQARFLLISGSRGYSWHKVLHDALTTLGSLDVVEESEAIELVMRALYDLVIVDATAIEKVALLVARIRAQRPNIRIMVATAEPTWDKATEAFHAGATDYVHKSLDRREIISNVSALLAKPGRIRSVH